MSEDNENKLDRGNVFLSYNGLNMPALIFGVPILFLVGLVAVAFFIGGAILYFLGKSIFIAFAILLLFAFLGVKLASENDPRAVYVVKEKLKGKWQFRFRRKIFVGDVE